MVMMLDCMFAFFFLFAFRAPAQIPHRTRLTVLSIDAKGVNYDVTYLGDLVRIEVEKLDTFELTDEYDAKQILTRNSINPEKCFGQNCLIEAGKLLKSDIMLTGSVTNFDDKIIISLKLIDVKKETLVKSYIKEFVALPEEVQTMLRISLRDLFGMPNEQTLVTKLTKSNDYDNIVNNPTADRLNLSGPRIGGMIYTGAAATFMGKSRNEGGYNAYPAMSQFGYQFEVQYLNEGTYQALFEFVPMITGLDQSIVIPSISILHGLRNNVNGWEIAIGPVFGFMPVAKGFYDSYNVWHLESESPNIPGYTVQTLPDSRGTDFALRTNCVIAVGKTFKSGRLNIPFNVFVIPAKDGARFGMSFGFNAKKK